MRTRIDSLFGPLRWLIATRGYCVQSVRSRVAFPRRASLHIYAAAAAVAVGLYLVNGTCPGLLGVCVLSLFLPSGSKEACARELGRRVCVSCAV